MSLKSALAAKGINLPIPPSAGGAYDPVRVQGGIAYVAIQFPVLDGQWLHRGRLGLEVTTEEGYQAARICALNVLAQLDRTPGLDALAGLNHIQAYMLVVDGWTDFPRVLDGASELLVAALGEVGRHSRSLSGVAHLPGNAPIALTVTATLASITGGRAV